MSNLVVRNAPPKVADLLRRQSAAIERMKESTKEQTEDMANSVEIAGTALAVGFVCGRYPDKAEIEGVPLGAVVSVAAYLAAFIGPRNYASHLKAIGKGALAAAATDFGRELGRDQLAKQNGQRRTAIGGVYPLR